MNYRLAVSTKEEISELIKGYEESVDKPDVEETRKQIKTHFNYLVYEKRISNQDWS